MDPVSVIIPAYDEPEGRLLSTIESAYHARATQVIVVDDGSATLPILPPYVDLEVYRQSHKGISAALNHGFQKAHHGLVAWLSAGDAYYSDKFQVQLAEMRATGARASFTRYRDSITGEVRVPENGWEGRIWTDNQFSCSTMVVTRAVWTDVGGFDESLLWCQDWDFACAVQAHCGWHYVQRELMTGPVAQRDGHTYRGSFGAGKARRDRDRATVARRWRHGGRDEGGMVCTGVRREGIR